MGDMSTLYEVTVTDTVEVTDREAVIEGGFQRHRQKLAAADKTTSWLREQWQGWVDDGTTDAPDLQPQGVDVALFEYVDADGRLSNMPGGKIRGWSSQQRLQSPFPED